MLGLGPLWPALLSQPARLCRSLSWCLRRRGAQRTRTSSAPGTVLGSSVVVRAPWCPVHVGKIVLPELGSCRWTCGAAGPKNEETRLECTQPV